MDTVVRQVDDVYDKAGLCETTALRTPTARGRYGDGGRRSDGSPSHRWRRANAQPMECSQAKEEPRRPPDEAIQAIDSWEAGLSRGVVRDRLVLL